MQAMSAFTAMNQDNYSCRIQHYTIEKDQVTYIILILNHSNGQIKLLKMRYSEIKKFHEKLSKIISSYKIQIYLPLLPGRKLLGKTNKDEKNIKNRQLDLQNYFNELLLIQKLHSLEMIKDLLPNQKPTKKNQQQQQQQQQAVIEEEEEEKIQKRQQIRIDIGEENEASNSFYGRKTYEEEKLDKFYWEPPQVGGDLKVRIDKYQIQEDTVNYFVTFSQFSNKHEWTYKTRFSELRSLHEALKSQNLKIKIPDFPKRKIFGITNENPEEIEKRREGLEKCMNGIFQIDQFVNNDVTQFFLQDCRRQAEQLRVKEEINILRKKKLKLKLSKTETLKIMQQITQGGNCEEIIKKLEEEKKIKNQQLQQQQQEEGQSENQNQKQKQQAVEKKKKLRKRLGLETLFEIANEGGDEKYQPTNTSLYNNLKICEEKAKLFCQGIDIYAEENLHLFEQNTHLENQNQKQQINLEEQDNIEEFKNEQQQYQFENQEKNLIQNNNENTVETNFNQQIKGQEEQQEEINQQQNLEINQNQIIIDNQKIDDQFFEQEKMKFQKQQNVNDQEEIII